MMFKTSIYDRLQKVRPAEPQVAPTQARSDYHTDTLCLLDGVALTAAGAVARGELPESSSPALSAMLRGPDGYGLLVHEIALHQSESQEGGARLDRRHQRLMSLIQSLVIDALLMLEALPEGTPFDVVLSAPIRHASLREIFLTQLRETIQATPFGEVLGHVTYRAASQASLHQLLAADESGGMPHVVWISVDSLLFESSVSELARRGQLGYASRPTGLFPGEAVSAVLCQRIAPESPAPVQGWQIPLAATLTHPARGSRELRRAPAPLAQLIERHWPAPAASRAQDDDSAETPINTDFQPVRLVIDSFGLPGRALEAGTSLVNRWPELDVIADGSIIDRFCGWPGDAWLGLALVLAMAELEEQDGALIVALADDSRTQGLALLPCAADSAVHESGA